MFLKDALYYNCLLIMATCRSTRTIPSSRMRAAIQLLRQLRLRLLLLVPQQHIMQCSTVILGYYYGLGQPSPLALASHSLSFVRLSLLLGQLPSAGDPGVPGGASVRTARVPAAFIHAVQAISATCTTRDLDMLEMFSGCGRLSDTVRRERNAVTWQPQLTVVCKHLTPILASPQYVSVSATHRAAYDINNQPVLNDVLSPTGYTEAIRLVLKIRPGGILFGGVPCSSFVFMSRGTTRRVLPNFPSASIKIRCCAF